MVNRKELEPLFIISVQAPKRQFDFDSLALGFDTTTLRENIYPDTMKSMKIRANLLTLILDEVCEELGEAGEEVS